MAGWQNSPTTDRTARHRGSDDAVTHSNGNGVADGATTACVPRGHSPLESSGYVGCGPGSLIRCAVIIRMITVTAAAKAAATATAARAALPRVMAWSFRC